MRPSILFFALLAFSIASGQPKGTVTEASLNLLGSKPVRTELKLTSTQESQVKAEFEKFGKTMQSLMKQRPANEKEGKALQTKAMAAQSTAIKALERILSAGQEKRLREIALQQIGPLGMLSPEIAGELGLNAAQKGKIEAARKEMNSKMMALQQKRQAEFAKIPQPKDPKDKKAVEAYQKKAQALLAKYGPGDQKTVVGYKQAAEAKALAALTAAQKTKWKSMLGKPFKPPAAKAS